MSSSRQFRLTQPSRLSGCQLDESITEAAHIIAELTKPQCMLWLHKRARLFSSSTRSSPFPHSQSGSPKLRCMLAECSTAQACCVNCLVIVDWSQTPDPEQHMDMGDPQAGVQMVQAMMLLWYDAIAQPGEAQQRVLRRLLGSRL